MSATAPQQIGKRLILVIVQLMKNSITFSQMREILISVGGYPLSAV